LHAVKTRPALNARSAAGLANSTRPAGSAMITPMDRPSSKLSDAVQLRSAICRRR
jgi:hypothetical protein